MNNALNHLRHPVQAVKFYRDLYRLLNDGLRWLEVHS